MLIKSIEKICTRRVYDLSIKDVEHYILDNGVITHNSGTKYANSLTLFLSKSKAKEGEEVVGVIIHCKLVKGRITKENTVVDTYLDYGKGLNRYYGLLNLAIKYEIAKKAKLKIEGEKGKEKYSLGGQVGSVRQINSNPEKYFTPEVMADLEKAAAREFNYGSNVTLTDEVDDINVEEEPETTE